MNTVLLFVILAIVTLHFVYDLGLLAKLWRWLRTDLRLHVRARKRWKRIKRSYVEWRNSRMAT